MTGAARAEFRAHWRVVLGSALGFGLGLSGIPTYTNGVFLPEITRAFHWSFARSQTSSLLTGLSLIVTAPLLGWLTDRIGAKRVAVISLIGFGLAYMLLSQLNGDYVFYLGVWALIAITGAGTQSTVWTRVIGTWFSAGRGFALGLTLMGSGLCAIFAPSLAALVIHAWGWRAGYVLLGALPLCIGLPAVLLLLPDRQAAAAHTAAHIGMSPGEAFRSWRYWLLGLVLLVVAVTVAGLIPNLVKMALLEHLTAQQGALLTGAVGLFVVLGRLGSGYLLDRFWGPAVAFAFLLALPLACLMLTRTDLGAAGFALAAALVGLAAAAEFDVIPYLIGRYFGVKRFGTLVGVINIFFAVGAGFGPMLFGRVLDVSGSYRPILFALAPACLAAAAALLVLGRYPVLQGSNEIEDKLPTP